MTHVDYFKKFFKKNSRGTAREICDFLIVQKAMFNCVPERRNISVNKHISSECGKRYPSGVVCREKNSDGVYEYFTE